MNFELNSIQFRENEESPFSVSVASGLAEVRSGRRKMTMRGATRPVRRPQANLTNRSVRASNQVGQKRDSTGNNMIVLSELCNWN